jgi:CheY-like chemotaxis protein
MTRILVVEDEAVIALDLRSRLGKAGYEVCALATTKEEAVQLAGQHRPALVLMDIRLEGGSSGIEAAAEIRKQYRIPVIYLTAYADEGTIEKAKLTRPYGYIMKPFQDQELRAAIEISLFRHESEMGDSQFISDALMDQSQTIYSTSVPRPPKPFLNKVDTGDLQFMRLPADAVERDPAAEKTWKLVLIPEGGPYPPIGIEVVDTIQIGRRVPGIHVDLDLSKYDGELLGVSRQHAMIRIEKNNLQLFDIGSTNGTYVNQTRAWLGRSLKLQDGDIVGFGSLSFKIKIVQRPAGT